MPRRKVMEPQEILQDIKKKNPIKIGPTTKRSIFTKTRRAIFALAKKHNFEPVEFNRRIQNTLYEIIVNQNKVQDGEIVEVFVLPEENKVKIGVYKLHDIIDIDL